MRKPQVSHIKNPQLVADGLHPTGGRKHTQEPTDIKKHRQVAQTEQDEGSSDRDATNLPSVYAGPSVARHMDCELVLQARFGFGWISNVRTSFSALCNSNENRARPKKTFSRFFCSEDTCAGPSATCLD